MFAEPSLRPLFVVLCSPYLLCVTTLMITPLPPWSRRSAQFFLLPRDLSLSVLTALSRPSSEALDVQAVKRNLPIDDSGKWSRAQQSPTMEETVRPRTFSAAATKRLRRVRQCPRIAWAAPPRPSVWLFRMQTLGDENAASPGTIRHVWA